MNEATVREISRLLAEADRRIKAAAVSERRRKGLSQQDVADLLGVDKSWVTEIEAYWSDPKMSEWRRYRCVVQAVEEKK